MMLFRWSFNALILIHGLVVGQVRVLMLIFGSRFGKEQVPERNALFRLISLRSFAKFSRCKLSRSAVAFLINTSGQGRVSNRFKIQIISVTEREFARCFIARDTR